MENQYTRIDIKRKPGMDIKPKFLDAMSKLVSSVHIVTTDGQFGKAGVTVSAVTSVTIDSDKPVMLCCLHQESSAAPVIIKNNCFCINSLTSAQREIADVFASISSLKNVDKFSISNFESLSTGSPVLSNSLVSFDCKLLSYDLTGSHHVILGEVQDLKVNSGDPLLYGNRNYVE